MVKRNPETHNVGEGLQVQAHMRARTRRKIYGGTVYRIFSLRTVMQWYCKYQGSASSAKARVRVCVVSARASECVCVRACVWREV